MIDLKGVMGIPLLKKTKFTGSEGVFRYVLEKHSNDEGDHLAAIFWRGEFCSDATPEEDKTTKLFPFSEEGLKQAQEWLNQKL